MQRSKFEFQWGWQQRRDERNGSLTRGTKDEKRERASRDCMGLKQNGEGTLNPSSQNSESLFTQPCLCLTLRSGLGLWSALPALGDFLLSPFFPFKSPSTTVVAVTGLCPLAGAVAQPLLPQLENQPLFRAFVCLCRRVHGFLVQGVGSHGLHGSLLAFLADLVALSPPTIVQLSSPSCPCGFVYSSRETEEERKRGGWGGGERGK